MSHRAERRTLFELVAILMLGMGFASPVLSQTIIDEWGEYQTAAATRTEAGQDRTEGNRLADA
jgi:hypothetical protein